MYSKDTQDYVEETFVRTCFEWGWEVCPSLIRLDAEGKKRVTFPDVIHDVTWTPETFHTAAEAMRQEHGAWSAVTLLTGERSGIVAFDRDAKGVSNDWIIPSFCPKDVTERVYITNTQSRGNHYLFRYDGLRFHGLTNKSNAKLAYDVRVNKGLLFLPPSQVLDADGCAIVGRTYYWLQKPSSFIADYKPEDLPEMPQALFDFIYKEHQPPKCEEEYSPRPDDQQLSPKQIDILRKHLEECLSRQFGKHSDRSGAEQGLLSACVFLRMSKERTRSLIEKWIKSNLHDGSKFGQRWKDGDESYFDTSWQNALNFRARGGAQ
jgi:hypothetical protein